MLDLVLYHTPNFYIWMVRWYYVAPAAAVIVGGLFLISVWRVWFEKVGGNLTAIKLLPPWLLSADNDAGPGIVVGEVHHQAKSSCFHPHHPVKAVEIPNPKWLVIPERPYSVPWGPAKPQLVCTHSHSQSCPGRPAIPGTGDCLS